MFGIFQLRPISSPLLGYNCDRYIAAHGVTPRSTFAHWAQYSRSHIPDIKLVPTALCITFFSASNSRLSSRSFFFPLLHPSLVPSLIYVHGHHSAVHVSHRDMAMLLLLLLLPRQSLCYLMRGMISTMDARAGQVS